MSSVTPEEHLADGCGNGSSDASHVTRVTSLLPLEHQPPPPGMMSFPECASVGTAVVRAGTNYRTTRDRGITLRKLSKMTNAGGITSRAAVSVFSGSGDEGRRTSVEAVQRTRRMLGRSALCSSTVLHSWDALLGLALVYTATVTIFEVAFLTDAPFNTLFWLNRVLDVIFITDMSANFFRPVFDHETGRTISKVLQ
jgi:hypothetical protein